MDRKVGTPASDGETGGEARLKRLLLSLALVLVVAYGVSLGFMQNPLQSVLGLALAAVSTRIGMAATAALIVVAIASLVLFLRYRSSLLPEGEPASITDTLAALADRATLIRRLDAEIEHHSTQGRQLALHLIDIDRFGALNAHGEALGDAFLAAVAEKLTLLTGDADKIGRIGDDEFAVIQTETGGARHAEIFARRLQDSVRETCEQAGRNLRLDASIGVAVAPEQGDDALKLLRGATLALNAVKQAGGGGFRIYSRHIDLAMDGRQQLEKALIDALDQGWFEVHYQPQYDLLSRRLIGFEALVRLNHPDLGMLMPNDFLRAACDAGIMPALGDWVLREATGIAANWPEHLKLAINAWVEELRSGDYAGRVGKILEAASFDRHRLRLEILESTLAGASAEVLQQVQALTTQGITAVVDDFGVGNSNLQALARSGCLAVKVDRSFVKAIGKSSETDAIVRGLIATAKAFGLEIMAEGIEQAEQVQFLLGNGCHGVQGYLFGRPVPPSELAVIIAKDLRNATLQATRMHAPEIESSASKGRVA